MDPDELSKKILKKAGERKSCETFDETSDRVDGVLERRNQAMKKIENYQKQHGDPSQDEANDNFLQNETGLGITMKDLKRFQTE